MNELLFALFAPSVIALIVIAAVITKGVWVGGSKWKD